MLFVWEKYNDKKSLKSHTNLPYFFWACYLRPICISWPNDSFAVCHVNLKFLQARVMKPPALIFLFNFFILLVSLINNLFCIMINGDTIFYFPITVQLLKSRLKSCCYMSNQVVPKTITQQIQSDLIKKQPPGGVL